jgi:putative transposase
MTPSDVHHGRAPEVRAARAYQQRPDRFVRKPPRPPELPAAGINKPDDDPQPAPHGFLELPAPKR